MKEYMINGKKRICFLVKKGEANDIVVDFDSLSRIDQKRFFEMESHGGELMRVMRDTTLDNGVNALVMYKDLFRIIEVPKKAVEAKKVESTVKEETSVHVEPGKRGRGRPKKKKD